LFDERQKRREVAVRIRNQRDRAHILALICGLRVLVLPVGRRLTRSKTKPKEPTTACLNTDPLSAKKRLAASRKVADGMRLHARKLSPNQCDVRIIGCDYHPGRIAICGNCCGTGIAWCKHERES
jgi:hypothetical protein